MRYFEFMPSKQLKEYINCYWVIQSDGEGALEGQWDRTMPDGSLEIIFHLEDRMLRKQIGEQPETESNVILIGQVTKPYLFTSTGDVSMLGVRFFPYSAHNFFDLKVKDFNDTWLDLELLDKSFNTLKTKLKEFSDLPRRIKLIEYFFIKKLQTSSTGELDAKDRYLKFACQKILRAQANVEISTISSEIGISNRYLEKIFSDKLGISPKFFARVIRFQNSLQYMVGKRRKLLTEVALKAGYYDQSHFIREFREFSGVTPQTYLCENHEMTDHFLQPENSSYLYNFR